MPTRWIALAALVAAIVLWASPPPLRPLVPGTNGQLGNPAPPPELAPRATPPTPTLAATPASPAEEDSLPDESEDWGMTTPGCRSLPLDVQVVDAASGRYLAARWVLAEGPMSERTVLTGPHGTLTARFVVVIPDGYATWDEPTVSSTVAGRATSLRHVHPLRPEGQAHLLAREPDGDAPGSASLGARVAGRFVNARWLAVTGSGPVAGLPFLRGERVTFAVAAPSRNPTVDYGLGSRVAEWVGRFGSDPEDPLRAEVTLPLEASGGAMWLGPSTPFGGLRFRIASYGVDAAEFGRLRVSVVGRDGRPLPDVFVRVTMRLDGARTDENGLAAFDVAVGDREVATEEPGVVTARASVRVASGETTRVTLREPEGGTVDVTVVDEAGLGLPFATLDVGKPAGLPHCDVSEDGVQRTDPYTDAFGRRALTHVDVGRLTISATFGERKGSVEIDVRDRERVTARIVVK